MAWSRPFIDPAIPLSRSERRQINRLALKRWMRNRINAALYAVGLIVAITMFMFLGDMIDAVFGYHRWYFSVAALVIYVGMLFGLFYLVQRFRYAPCVYAELREMQFNVCPRCGYWLRGLDETVTQCPECGSERRALRESA